ncbi:MAG: FadR family transcriptional regulator [Vallitalea sp.]|jgi:DNA-binding FadR family transcriptional regulator|nr:FadR family transcriptional regulator [Vallitalea sp.]
MYDKGILSEKIADDIRKMILEKELQPGDKLPNEIELTDMLNIGRSTVREAIKILVSTNILEVKRGKGTYVSENPGVLKDPLGITFMEDSNLLLHFFEMRIIIEPQIAELAAIRATEKDIMKIKKAYEQVELAIKNNTDHTSSDIDFHNAIAKSTHNPIINRIVPIINDGIKGGYAKTKDIPESGEVVLIHHKKIFQAIKNKKQDLAKQYMKEHILYGFNETKKININN